MITARKLALLVAGAAVAASAIGLAAGLGSASRALGANKVSVPRCDTDGVTVLQNLSGSNVVSVTVGSIAATCATATISVNVNNGTANSTGTGTVPAGGGSLTVTLASAVAAQDAEQTDVSITGP